MKIYNRLTGKADEISVVLKMLASQEGCDGEPYDEMMAAADYIEELEEVVAALRSRIKRGA